MIKPKKGNCVIKINSTHRLDFKNLEADYKEEG